jgi:hypothetical protein
VGIHNYYNQMNIAYTDIRVIITPTVFEENERGYFMGSIIKLELVELGIQY